MQAGELDEDAVEPPVPPGLQHLSAPLKSLAVFLRIDKKLLKAAAKSSRAEVVSPKPLKKELAGWIAKLPVTEKDKILLKLAEGDDPYLSMNLLQRFRESRGKQSDDMNIENNHPRRTVGELLAKAELDYWENG